MQWSSSGAAGPAVRGRWPLARRRRREDARRARRSEEAVGNRKGGCARSERSEEMRAIEVWSHRRGEGNRGAESSRRDLWGAVIAWGRNQSLMNDVHRVEAESME